MIIDQPIKLDTDEGVRASVIDKKKKNIVYRNSESLVNMIYLLRHITRAINKTITKFKWLIT